MNTFHTGEALAGLGWGEIALVAVLVLVFVGPDDLPKLLRFLGRTYGKLRRASDDLRRTFTLEVDKVDAEARSEEIQRRRNELLSRRKAEAERVKQEGGALPRAPKAQVLKAKPGVDAGASDPDQPTDQPREGHELSPKAAPEQSPAASPELPEHTAQAEKVLQSLEQKLKGEPPLPSEGDSK